MSFICRMGVLVFACLGEFNELYYLINAICLVLS